ncbi:MAG TPA: outer membrane beta-barrel protein [Longimicrobiales bacterium]|nr:outer membrane beta-barrel protein [Longimicrobiales bacterium]
MRRTITAAALVLPAVLLLTGTAQAQESTTRGFNLGFHLSGASISPEDGDSSEGGGAGLTLGYGINRTVQLFLQLDGTAFDVDDAAIQGDWEMGHADLGVRFHFANSLRWWVPYLQAALSGRAVGVDDAVVQGQTERHDVSFAGGAFSLSGGILLYFNETLAADLQLIWSNGEFTEIEVENVTISDLEIDAETTRLNVGISWWP